MIGSGERRRKREWVACLIDLSLAVLHKLAVNQTAALSGSPVQRDDDVKPQHFLSFTGKDCEVRRVYQFPRLRQDLGCI